MNGLEIDQAQEGSEILRALLDTVYAEINSIAIIPILKHGTFGRILFARAYFFFCQGRGAILQEDPLSIAYQ